MSESPLEKLVRLSEVGTLDRSPKKNWIEAAGGLPHYIEEIAKDLVDKGHPISRAIAIAVSRVKVWAATSKNPDVKAKASVAVVEWEKLRAKSGAKGASK